MQFDTRAASLLATILANLPPVFDALLLARHRFGMRRIRRESLKVRNSFEAAGLLIAKELHPDSGHRVFVVVKRL